MFLRVRRCVWNSSVSEKTFKISDCRASFTSKLLHDVTDLDIEACWVRARMRTECPDKVCRLTWFFNWFIWSDPVQWGTFCGGVVSIEVRYCEGTVFDSRLWERHRGSSAVSFLFWGPLTTTLIYLENFLPFAFKHRYSAHGTLWTTEIPIMQYFDVALPSMYRHQFTDSDCTSHSLVTAFDDVLPFELIRRC